MNNLNIDLIENSELNNTLILESFTIQEYKSNYSDVFLKEFHKKLSRYNILTFIYFLNTPENGFLKIITDKNENILINPIKGKLIIFPENLNYKYLFNLPNIPFYIITGQLKSNNK
jgi:deoxyadenosine/deoxycytidine kinase